MKLVFQITVIALAIGSLQSCKTTSNSQASVKDENGFEGDPPELRTQINCDELKFNQRLGERGQHMWWYLDDKVARYGSGEDDSFNSNIIHVKTKGLPSVEASRRALVCTDGFEFTYDIKAKSLKYRYQYGFGNGDWNRHCEITEGVAKDGVKGPNRKFPSSCTCTRYINNEPKAC